MHAEHAAFVVAASFLFVIALAAVAVISELAAMFQAVSP